MDKYEKQLIESVVKWAEIKKPLALGKGDLDLIIAVANYVYQQIHKLQNIFFLEEERDRLMFEYLRMDGRIMELKLKDKALPQEVVSRISELIASNVKVCDCLVGEFGIDGKYSVCMNCKGIREDQKTIKQGGQIGKSKGEGKEKS